MLLSNLRNSLVLIGLFALFLQACGSISSNTKPAPTPVETGRFPFPTKEPDVYQGDLAVGDGATEQLYFVARKGEKWRFDIKKDGAPLTTQLRSDRVYFINHVKKTYSMAADGAPNDFDTSYFNTLSWGFFRGADYLDYEEIGREGKLIRYRARMRKDAKSEVIVTIDESTGMMVRQEITGQRDPAAQGASPGFIYEVRNLQLTVDDSVFEIPAGYKPAPRRN